MANHSSHSLSIPIYASAFNVDFDYFATDATTPAPTSLDTEVSKDAGTYADCTNEVTLFKEVGGATDAPAGYITLTAAEMTADLVNVQSKSANCVTQERTFRPCRLTTVRASTLAGSADTSHVQLDGSASAVDDFYNGLWIRTDTLTGAGQARRILDYAGSTKIATLETALETAVDATTTFTIGFVENQAVNAFQLDAAVQTRLAPATVGRTLVVDASGLADANMVKVGPTGTGTAQTAADLAANQTTILARLGSWTGSARNTILGALQALFRKDADATVPSDVNANLGGGAGVANNTTDSLEAQRDNIGTNGAALTALGDTRLANLDVAVSSRGTSTLTAQNVWEYATRTLSAFGFGVTVTTNNDKTGYTLTVTPPTASDNATAVWAALSRTLTSGAAPSAADIADAVWDEASTGHTDAGKAGTQLWTVLNATSTLTAQQVWEYATRTLSAFGFGVTVTTNNDKTGYTLTVTPPTAATIADAVWDEGIAGHAGVGSTGEALSGATAPSAATVADAVWDEASADHVAVGSTGKALADVPTAGEVDTQLSSVHGAGAWGPSDATGSCTVTLTVDDGTDPVADVKITVYNNAQTALVKSAMRTDVNGQVSFPIDPGTYKVTVDGGRNYDALAVQTLTAAGITTTDTYSLTAFSPGAAPDPDDCRVYGWLLKGDGTVVEGGVVTFQMLGSGHVEADGATVDKTAITATSDAAGYYYADLLRSTVADAKWRVTNTACDLDRKITVPDAASVSIETI